MYNNHVIISLKINKLKLRHCSHSHQEVKHSVAAVLLADNKVMTLVVLDPLLLEAGSRIAIERASDLPICESLLQLQIVHKIPSTF